MGSENRSGAYFWVREHRKRRRPWLAGRAHLNIDTRLGQERIGPALLAKTTARPMAADEADVRAIVALRAKDAGTDNAEIDVSTEFKVSTVEAQRMFIEAHVVAVASGRPRIAV